MEGADVGSKSGGRQEKDNKDKEMMYIISISFMDQL